MYFGKPLTFRVAPNGCHECTSHAIDIKGYPLVSHHGKHCHAGRKVFEEMYGPIPAGMMALHLCDNPTCINPEHLFLGTAKDNYADARRKGRNSHGPKHGHAAFTWDQVKQIRSTSATKELADKYGVDRTTIQRVRRGVYYHRAALRRAAKGET